MEDVFEVDLPVMHKKALIRKADYYLTIIRENLSNVSVDRLPLIEYFVFIDNPNKGEQIKAKLFKTVAEGKWYDENYSEEAASNSPEFGIPDVNQEIKVAIDNFESAHSRIGIS